MSTRIVLVHGFGRDLHDWDEAVLTQRGRRVHHRRARRVRRRAAGRRPSLHPDRARGARRRAGSRAAVEPVHVVGNCLGGLVGVIAAARLPHTVATLTLVAPALPLGGSTRAGLRLALLGAPAVGPALTRAARRRDLDERTRELLRLTFARPHDVDPERVARLRAAGAERDLVRHADAAFTASLRGISLQHWRPGVVRRALASLPMPVTALYGRHDRLVPVGHARAFRRLLPAADVRVLEHAGHLIQLEDPQDVVDAVRRRIRAYAGSEA